MSTSWEADLIAGVHSLMNRQLPEAEALLRSALTKAEAEIGAGDRRLASILGPLAAVCSEQGDYDGATEFWMRRLGVEESVWGSEHPIVAKTLSALAGVYRKLGRETEAVEAEARAQLIWDQHALTLRTDFES
ncbi:MAG TPA: tetratricopeptide repeat protein [Armatimonadota bacterium]|nr:tetratricopeptide repeat protein [Armatimonadota bacterium]